MSEYTLEIELLSDTTFGRGDGVAGVVDIEVQHDEAGLPILSGRAIKGLLVNECAELLFALSKALPDSKVEDWQKAALNLFGEEGETIEQARGLIVGAATVAPDLAAHVRYEVASKKHALSQEDVLESLTSIRHQTAIDAISGAPRDESLRTTRVVIRGLKLYAPIAFESEPGDIEKALLAACVMALRRAGTGRTRGKGRLKVEITRTPLEAEQFATAAKPSPNLVPKWFTRFKEEVKTT